MMGIRRIEQTGKYAISAKQVWRPGSFESQKAAWHGQRLSDAQIQVLQDRANEAANGKGGVITLAMIQDFKAGEG